jgi:hypothetical protein
LFKKVIYILLTLSILLIIPNNTFAYEYYGGLNNYEFYGGISSGHYSNRASDNFTINGDTYDFKTAYQNAYNDWYYSVSDLGITSSTSNGSLKLIFYAGDYGELGLNGWAEFWSSKGNVQPCSSCAPTADWSRASTYLNAHDLEDDGALTQGEVEAVATHEIGHALGLAHELDTTAVMDDVEFLNRGWLNVQYDDEIGVEKLY